ncbi:Eco57I restriction-modification methylase domain-containing protein [Neobacillus sp. PS3-40]|uniref:Eco57I restriction-modification methylase domain-containing protein n=1 Tax=Neobacillus sp. PS3-40 TaxID=3070679 RepID=UPI0027DFB94B|nr:N-6 DNA methylase [Neobacillus sp. PS3-40]WML42643.1 N-6 DNA methylase [Neobacillus sp. PS3-40]
MEENKVNGSYYTPRILAKLLVEKALNYAQKRNLSILEPSCGDGVFLKELLGNDDFLSRKESSICVVEKNHIELEKTKKYKKNFSENQIKTSFNAMDFLDFVLHSKKKFNLILGNPPYIHKKFLSDRQIDLSKTILKKIDLDVNTIYNIWMPFVVGCSKLLSSNGVLCLILPAELLQVKYAEPIRKFLFREFNEFHIMSFDNQIFKGIEQDVVVFFGIKNSNNKTITHELLSNTADQLEVIERNILKPKKYLNKWLWYLMSNEEIELLIRIKNDFHSIDTYCKSSAGIVTGNNSYFILNQEQVRKYNLGDWVKPILKKSAFTKNSLTFSKKDFNALVVSNNPCFLLDLNNMNSDDDIPYEIEDYLKRGIDSKVQLGYKCKVRNDWYKVPSIWTSEGIFFKRIHLVPKLIKNTMKVNITDTGYRISMIEDYSINSLIFSFYNSLTLLLLELEGRYYGGGVLEVTPNEFKNIAIPYLDINQKEFNKLKSLVNRNKSIEEILQYTDEIILINHFGIDHKTLEIIRRLREKIVKFRVN